MKTWFGSMTLFASGMVGFLLLYKVLILDTTPPSDELAPGMVLILSIVYGFVFVRVVRWVWDRVTQRAFTRESGQ